MRDYQDQKAGDGTESQDPPGGRILHVDPDGRARERLAERLSESDLEATFAGVGSADAALDRLTGQAFDCAVVDLDRPTRQWEEFVEAAPEGVALVLYTDRDPTELPESVMRRIDSLVQKGNGEAGWQLLVEKIRRGLEEGADSHPDPETLVAATAGTLGVFLLGDDGRVEWASQPVEAFFQAEDVPGTDDFYARLAGLLADSPEAAKAVAGVQGTDETREEALSIPGPDGDARQYRHESYPLPAEHPQTRVEIFEDLTRERERKSRMEFLETLVMGSQDGLYTLDANGVIDFCNPAMAEQLGYEREELLGMHASEVMAEGELKDGQNCIEEVVHDPGTESTVCDMTFRTKGGEPREVSLHVTRRPSPDGSYAGLIGVMRNITERKEYERELQRFETIIQAVGDGVYATNGDGEFTYVNQALADETGYSPGELVGEDASILLGETDREKVMRLIDDLLDSEESTGTVEVEAQTASGESFPAEVHAALLPDGDSGYRGMAGIARDVTERRRREKRLEEFTSIVAHDLRNPLSVGRGNLDLYRETGDETRLDAVADAFDDMEQLIDDLLELATVGEVIGETAAVDLREAARRAWEHVRTEEATLIAGDGLGEVRADCDRLTQALENLFRNAIEHGQAPVTVRIGTTPDGFFVSDDGPGIAPERREEVFERGYTTADEGTGFGLAIVARIVEAHGWSIDVTESADGGARFEVSGVEFA